MLLTTDTPAEDVRDALASRSSSLGDDELVAASEVAYRHGDLPLGIKAMRLLVDRSADNPDRICRLASFHHMAGERAQAEPLYRAAIAIDPRCAAAYHGLRELQMSLGDINGALDIAQQEAAACGESAELLFTIGSLLRIQCRYDDALTVFRRVTGSTDASPKALRAEVEIALELGLFGDALAAAERLCERAPGDQLHEALRARVLYMSGRFEAAVSLLTNLVHQDTTGEWHRLLSGALVELGRYRDALSAAIAATELAPQIADYWYHAASVANVLGYQQQALDSMARAIALDPDNPNLRLAHAHLLNGLGRPDEALRSITAAADRLPREAEIKDLQLALLSSAADAPEPTERYSVLFKPLPRSLARPLRVQDSAGELSNFLHGIRIQLRVIIALASRELSHRTAHSRLGLMSAIVEPALQIVMLGLVLTIFNHGRPPLGNSLFFFYATGVLPFYLFMHVVQHNLEIYAGNASLLQVPRIHRIDLVIGVALAELFVGIMTTVLVFGLFFYFGFGQGTNNLIQAVPAYLCVWLFSLGVALITSLINNLTRTMQTLWHTIVRFLYFLSGIFFIPQMWPYWIRQYLIWNPLLIGIEWFRTAFFHEYRPPWIAKGYLVTASVACVVIGLAMERALRRKLRAGV